MYIVHVVRQFYPAVGGFEGVVRELAKAQVVAGHRVRIITLNRLLNAAQRQELPARDMVDGAEVVRIPFAGSQRYPLAPSALKFIRDADIVHVHAIDFFCDYLAWTKPLHRRKLVISTHGGFFHTSFAARLKRLYFSTITRMSLTWYDGVTAVSAADFKLFSKIRKHDIVCVENGVNAGKYAGASSAVPAKCILALGRLSGNKRLDRLISFVAALRRRDARWKLTIAGRCWDVEAHHLAALAETLRIRDAVEIVADPDEGEIRRLMSSCSVIASASEYEGFGVAAVEGMSAGLFPLLSDIPTFRLLLGRAGLGMLVDFSDPEAAADEFIAKWREIEADYHGYQAKLTEVASAYAWPRVSETYAKIYDSICGTTKRTILNVPVCVGTVSQTVKMLDARFDRADSTIVAFANAHALNVAARDKRVRAILQKSVILNDGIGVDIASLLLFGRAFPQNLNGTDFTPRYLQDTRHRFRIFLLGSRPGVVERAREHLSKMLPQHQIVGFHHGYFTENERAHINAMIRACDTDIILVGMGNPAQELWLANNLAATGARLGFAVGALFDFVSGHVPRAPAWMLSTRVEWAYRLVQEPSRLWRRYLIGIPLFILRILHQWSTRAEANQVVAACDEARPTSLPDSAAILSPTTAWRDGGGKIGVSGALPNASYVSVADGK
jgi:alpha-1,3-mannosyltransferase